MLKWLAGIGEGVPQVEKAAAVSVPYNLARAAHNLDRGFNRQVYTRFMLTGLKYRALELEKRFPGIVDAEKVRRAATFEIYDREVTARLNGFQDEEDYWQRASCVSDLEKIRKPVLLIHAENDPFLPAADLPLKEIKSSPFLELLLTREGGHLGFVSGKVPFRREPWLELTILDYLAS